MMDLHRKTIEVMDRHGIDYPHANVLGKGPNRSHRNINYSTAFCVALLILSAIGWIFAR